jgi:hypothetical protein
MRMKEQRRKGMKGKRERKAKAKEQKDKTKTRPPNKRDAKSKSG